MGWSMQSAQMYDHEVWPFDLGFLDNKTVGPCASKGQTSDLRVKNDNDCKDATKWVGEQTGEIPERKIDTSALSSAAASQRKGTKS